MISVLMSATILGLIGSVHCIGMCGPISFSLPLPVGVSNARLKASLVYNVGRIIMYAVLGMCFGAIGFGATFFGYQQWLSVTIGVLIILFTVLPKKIVFRSNKLSWSLNILRNMLDKFLRKKSLFGAFYIGLINGLLPCGLIYIAIAGSVATGSIVSGGLFMAAFGFGTMPLMLMLSILGVTIGSNTRIRIRSFYPYMMCIIACFFIIRGLGLNIPYLSPSLHPHIVKAGIIECHA